MKLAFDIPKLTAYARQRLSGPATLQQVHIEALAGGYVGAGVYRLDLEFQQADNQPAMVKLAQKLTTASEVRTMQTLATAPALPALPTLIDSYANPNQPDENGASWFITPFYEGDTLASDAELPAVVIQTLAGIHADFAATAGEIDWLHRVDATFFRRTFVNAITALLEASQGQASTAYAVVAEQVKQASENAILFDLLNSLPVTLTHGDVHSGNFLQSPAGDVVLIDWGNARIAPAMLDVTNMVKLDSANYHRYLTEWEAASGQSVDDRQMRLSYHWATIMVNAQYLPFAANFLPVDRAEAMAQKIRDALAEIEQLYRI